MSAFILASPREADDLIARLFESSMTCRLSAREDMAFKDGQWFDFGRIELFPIFADSDKVRLASRRGQYEWTLPTSDAARTRWRKFSSVFRPAFNRLTSPDARVRSGGAWMRLRRSQHVSAFSIRGLIPTHWRRCHIGARSLLSRTRQGSRREVWTLLHAS
jgi:hypothetical protein